MGWRFTDDVEEYARQAGPLLHACPAENTVSLTVIENARARPQILARDPEIYGWWADTGGEVTGAVSHTPPHEMLLGVVPDVAMRPLVVELARSGRDLPGVNGATGTAVQFAALWSAHTAQRAVLRDAERLYRLGRLAAPDPEPPGRARVATASDTELLVDWMLGFVDDAGLDSDAKAVEAAVRDKMSYGGLTLWENGDGMPVSLAGRSRRAAGTVRVAPVYTPADHRRQGWASAVTAAVSQAVLDEGAREVVLFTDLANPTSNSIYQRLGYRPMTDRAVLRFEPAG
jgi:GNAT superfamily N-acetyltransferase